MNAEKLLARLPAFKGQTDMITRKQSVARIIRELVRAHIDYRGDYDRIAEFFITGSNLQTEKDLFNFCKENFNYVIEPEKNQTLRSPAAIIILDMIKGVDCKHYASFIGGVLDAINRTDEMYFDWYYRFASYSITDRVPEHVFVVVNDNGHEIWIDPVLDTFNGRLPFPIYIRDIKSKAGASVSGHRQVAGIGALSRISGVGALSRISGPAGYRSTNYALSPDSSCSTGCGHSLGLIRRKHERVGGNLFLDIFNQAKAEADAQAAAALTLPVFNIEPPPSGSKPLGMLPNWPAGLPYFVISPDGRVMMAGLPISRKPTTEDLSYLLTSLQAIYNSYLKAPTDVFRYVSPKGSTYAGFINSYLQHGYGSSPFLFIPKSDFLALPQLFADSTSSWVDAVGKTLSSIVGLIPVIGNISNLVISIDANNEAKVAATTAVQQQQVLQTASAIQQSGMQQQQPGSPALTWLKSNPGLTVLIAAGAAYGLSKYLK